MDDGSPTLSVGFAIDTAGSFDALTQLASVMDSTEARIVRDAAAIERATTGMVNVGGATARLQSFGSAATRAEETVRREKAQTERSIDGYIRKLDAETAAVGRTRAEQRDARIEALALAAARQGNTDAADRLLASTRQLKAAQDALAEDRLAAETREAAQASREREIAEAAVIVQLRERSNLEAALGRINGADRPRATDAGATFSALAAVEAARERAVAEAAVTAQLRERANLEAALARTSGADRPRATDVGATFSALAARAAEEEARALAMVATAAKQAADEHARLVAAVRGSQAAQEADAAAAERLRAATDPLYAATRRLNDEIAESTRLYYAGATAPGEYARQQQVLTGRLAEVGRSHDTMAGAARRNGFALQQVALQMPDVVGGLLTGQKPMTIFIQQGFQIVQVAQMAEGGLKGFARQLLASAAPFTPFIAAAGLAAAGFALFSRSVSDGIDTTEMVNGLGLTRAEIKRLKDTSVDTGDVVTATFQVLAKNVGLDMTGVKSFFGDAMDFMTTVGRKALAGLYTMWTGTFGALAAAVKALKEGRFDDILSDMGQSVVDRFNAADAAMVRFGKSVTAQIAANKKADLEKQAAELKKDRTPKVDHTAERLAREAAATEAQIRGLYRLADAYGVSGGAVLIAEARVKAETSAIKKQGEIEEFVARQVRLAIAERVNTAAEGAAAMREQARIQTEVNGEVAAGNIPAARANELLQERMAELPLLAALEAAEKVKDLEGIKRVTAALEVQRQARENAHAADKGAFYLAASAEAERQLATQREELRLVGATDMERVRALATLKATQDLEAKGYSTTDAYALKFIGDQVKIAVGTAELAAKTAQLNSELRLTADLADDAATSLSRSFGRVGDSIGDAIRVLGRFGAEQQRIADAVDARTMSQAEADRRTANLRINGLIDLAGAAKGLFREHSKGYAAMAAAEKALTLLQLARTAVDVAGGAARMFASLGPFAFPAVAAMLGVMASLGFGGGSAGSYKAPETNKGTGTVLGDPAAQSESIKRSIDALRQVDTLQLTASRQMLASLRSIDAQIGSFAAKVAQAGNVNADSQVATKTPSGILGSLFGTKVQVTGSGLFARGQAFGDILNGGFDAQTYSDTLKTSKFLGITTSKKTSTVYGAADAALEQQFTLILRSFNDAIVAAAGPLGQSTADIASRVSSFVFDLGKVDLSGLSGEEIQSKLTAVFGAAADNIAAAALPGFERFQRAGEGMFETVVRVASTVEQVTATLGMLGAGTRNLSVDAKVALAAQFDSIGDMTSAVSAYAEAFYTPAEQAVARTAQLGAAFTGLGVAMPATLDGFRRLVEAQDLTTSAGQATYATLLQLAPAFADLKTAMDGTKSAADVLAERQDLERKMLELRGDTAALRELDLAKLDASNRGLQQQIYAVQDAQEAAKAAESLRDAWKSVGDTIQAEIQRIRGLTGAGGDASFASLQGQFNAATASARLGDQDAAKLLPGLSQSLLKAASDVATSRQELDRVQAQTAASLEQTFRAISGLGGGANGNAATLAAAATATQATSAPRASNDDAAAELRAMRVEAAAMRADLNAALATIAGNTGRTARKLEDVTADSGGDAISTRAAA